MSRISVEDGVELVGPLLAGGGLLVGESSGDGLAVDLAGPWPVGHMCAWRVGVAGAGGVPPRR